MQCCVWAPDLLTVWVSLELGTLANSWRQQLDSLFSFSMSAGIIAQAHILLDPKYWCNWDTICHLFPAWVSDPLFPFWGRFRLPALLRLLAFGSQHAITMYCPRLLAQMCARCLVILTAIFSEFLLVYWAYFSNLLVTWCWENVTGCPNLFVSCTGDISLLFCMTNRLLSFRSQYIWNPQTNMILSCNVVEHNVMMSVL